MKFAFAALVAVASAIKLEHFDDTYVQSESLEVLGLDGYRWFQAITPAPEDNYCTNANKATGTDQACSDPGNSAWNTHTSSVTKKPVNAQSAPYPDHPYVTYGVQGEVYTSEEEIKAKLDNITTML